MTNLGRPSARAARSFQAWAYSYLESTACWTAGCTARFGSELGSFGLCCLLAHSTFSAFFSILSSIELKYATNFSVYFPCVRSFLARLVEGGSVFIRCRQVRACGVRSATRNSKLLLHQRQIFCIFSMCFQCNFGDVC